MQKAKSESESSLLFVDYNNLEKDWKVQGFKNEVEAALFQIDQAEGLLAQLIISIELKS